MIPPLNSVSISTAGAERAVQVRPLKISAYLTIMSPNIHKYRYTSRRLQPSSARSIVVLTGARQTGKTTLCKAAYPSLRYINLDAAENRDTLRQLSTLAWADRVGCCYRAKAQGSKVSSGPRRSRSSSMTVLKAKRPWCSLHPLGQTSFPSLRLNSTFLHCWHRFMITPQFR